MQLTENELQRQVTASNKESYFLKNPNKVLVINIPSGDLRFSIDLSRLTPFLLEYLTYQTEEDRAENMKYNKDKYGVFEFLTGKIDTSADVTKLEANAQFAAWIAEEKNAAKLTASLDGALLDGIMKGLGMTDEEVFYLVRDDAEKVSGIDLSDIDYDSNSEPEPEPEPESEPEP